MGMFETIVECKTEAELDAVCALMTQMYPDRSAPTIKQQIQQMLTEGGWRVVGIFEDAQCIATLLVHVGHRLYCGKFIRMDSMVIDKNLRSRGLGKKLFRWVEEEGERLGCKTLLLDSYVENHDGHRFFLREGMAIRGFHINKTFE